MPAIRLQGRSLLVRCPKDKSDVTIRYCLTCESRKKPIAFDRVNCREEIGYPKVPEILIGKTPELDIEDEEQFHAAQIEKAAHPEKAISSKLNIVYFDLETKNLIDAELQKVDLHPMHYRNLGMSVAVTQSTLYGEAVYTEDKAQSLIHQLLVCDAIVGFNHVKFDYVVLSAYMNDEQIKGLYKVKTLDMMIDLEERLGHRVSLDSCVTATLGDQKSASGVQAVEWYQKGEIEKVIEYCKKDVDVTKRLHEFGCQHNYIKFLDKYKVQTRQIYVDWKVNYPT